MELPHWFDFSSDNVPKERRLPEICCLLATKRSSISNKKNKILGQSQLGTKRAPNQGINDQNTLTRPNVLLNRPSRSHCEQKLRKFPKSGILRVNAGHVRYSYSSRHQHDIVKQNGQLNFLLMCLQCILVENAFFSLLSPSQILKYSCNNISNLRIEFHLCMLSFSMFYYMIEVFAY